MTGTHGGVHLWEKHRPNCLTLQHVAVTEILASPGLSLTEAFWCLIPNCLGVLSSEEKAEPPQAMNALMRLNQLKPGLQYKLVSQTGPVHAPIFTMSVEVDGSSFEASGPSKKTAKLHVAVKVSVANVV